MELNEEELSQLSPLALSNTITLSALVAILIRKGLVTDEELVQEIRALKARIGVDKGGE